LDINYHELLVKLRESVGNRCCCGIRLLKNDSIEIFYHPYGCESEWTSTTDDFDNLIERILEWRDT